MAVTASDSGIASSEMSVVRAESRKAKSTIATMIAPSRSASATLVIEARMKSAWRKRTCGAASRLSTSASVRLLGSERGSLGASIFSVGSAVILPWRSA